MSGPIFLDRVLETSTTTGTGTYALAGAVTGYQSFAGVGDGNQAHYVAYAVDSNGNANGGWEVGLGTYASSGTTLARTQVLASSNSGAAVNWGVGTKRIALTLAASHFAQTDQTHSRALSLLSDRPTKTVTQPNGDYFVNFPSAGNTVNLINLASGSVGIVTAVQMSMDGGAGSYDCRLRVYVDQEVNPSIDVDVGTLFVSHLDAHTGAGQTLSTDHIQMEVVGTNTHPNFTGSNTQCSYQMQFPIPYSDGIRIEIYTPASGVTIPGGTYLFSMVNYREGAISPYRLRSRGVTRIDANAASANSAGSDIALMDVPNNKGWAVWFSTACFGATNYSYLERPHRYFIDGETGTSSFILTGGEEYGATGWYFGAASRYNQAAVLLGATNNASFTTVVGCDFLRMYGGIKFENELRLVHGNKTNYPATSDHKMAWCLLYYVDSTMPFVPTAPRSLSATPSAGQIVFDWLAPLSQGSVGISGYTITLDNGGGSYTVAGNVLTKTVTGLTNGVSYTATVVATNAVGNSSASNSASATPAAQVATPGAGSLALTGRAPTVHVNSDGLVTPSAGTIAITGRAPTVSVSSSYSIYDDFNRADNGNLGTTSVGGKTWNSYVTASTASHGIASNRAYVDTNAAGTCYAFVDTASANIDVSVTLAVIGTDAGYAGLVARVVDADNLVLLQYESATNGATSYGCYKKVSGSYTLLGSSSAITPTAGDVLRLVVSGTNTVDFYINGTHFGPFTATGISSSSVNAGMQGGRGSNPNTARFDNFGVV